MGAIPARTVARRLRRLDREEFASFVASLWAASGWETQVDGSVVTVRRSGEQVRIGVLPPRRLAGRWRPVHLAGKVDAVAWAGGADRLPPGTPSADIVDATVLRERLLFALEPATADRIATEYLGVPARADRWEGEPSAPVRAVVTGLGRQPVAVVGVVFFVLVGFALAPALLPGGAPAVPGDETGPGDAAAPGDEPIEQDADSPEAESGSADDEDEALAPVPEPTCERGPGEVATTVSNAMHLPEEDGPGLRVLWEFTDPELRETRHYQRFHGYYQGPWIEPLQRADEVVLDGVVREGRDAEVYVVAPTPDGNTTYVFGLRQRERGDRECWTIRSVSQA